MFPRPWLGVWDDGERGGLRGRKGVSYVTLRWAPATLDATWRCGWRFCVPVVLEGVVPHGAPESTLCFLDLGSVFGLMGIGEGEGAKDEQKGTHI